MTSGGLQELAAKGLSPGKWMSFANDTFKAWSLGRNLDQLARIITDPRSGNAFNQIIRIPPGSDRAVDGGGAAYRATRGGDDGTARQAVGRKKAAPTPKKASQIRVRRPLVINVAAHDRGHDRQLK
jgi:hypothetical protein